MPFLVSTNTPGTGMDAPTWRGAYDRFPILPQGRLNIIDFDFYRAIAERGILSACGSFRTAADALIPFGIWSWREALVFQEHSHVDYVEPDDFKTGAHW